MVARENDGTLDFVDICTAAAAAAHGRLCLCQRSQWSHVWNIERCLCLLWLGGFRSVARCCCRLRVLSVWLHAPPCHNRAISPPPYRALSPLSPLFPVLSFPYPFNLPLTVTRSRAFSWLICLRRCLDARPALKFHPTPKP